MSSVAVKKKNMNTSHVHIERDYNLIIPDCLDLENTDKYLANIKLPNTTRSLRYAREGRDFYNLYSPETSIVSKDLSINSHNAKCVKLRGDDSKTFNLYSVLKETDEYIKNNAGFDFNTGVIESISNMPIKRLITQITLLGLARDRDRMNVLRKASLDNQIPFLAVSSNNGNFYSPDTERNFIGGVYQYYADLLSVSSALYREHSFISGNIKAIIDYN